METFPLLTQARLRVYVTLAVILVGAVVVSWGLLRSFRLPEEAASRLEHYLRQQEERRLRGEDVKEEKFPGPALQRSPGSS